MIPSLKSVVLETISNYSLIKLNTQLLFRLNDRLIKDILTQLKLIHYFELKEINTNSNLNIKEKQRVNKLIELFIVNKWKGKTNLDNYLQYLWRKELCYLLKLVNVENTAVVSFKEFRLTFFNIYFNLFFKVWLTETTINKELKFNCDDMELIYFTKLIIKGIESIKLNFVDFYEKNEYLNDPIFRLNTIQYHHLDLEKLSHRIKHKEENCVFDLIFNDKISSLGFYFCNFNYSKKELIPYFKALLLVNKQVIFNKKDVSNNMKSNIKELILLSTTLSYESSNIINQLFNKIQLKTIKLINCQLKDDCYFILFKNLIGSFYFNELYLENVILNDTIGDILIELLSHPNCQLKVLSLSNSYIIKEFLVKLSIGLSKNVTLMELNLDKVGIENEDNESMCKLLKSISQHKKLEIINLSQFEIELDLISNLLSHLNQIDNLKELNLFGLYLANPSSLYQLSSLFQHSKLNVLKLDFKGCKFKEIAAPFFKLFSDIKNLKQICIPSSRITDIDIEYLINYLIDTSLHLIDLSNNQITIHGIKKLFDCLKKCRNSKLKVKLNGNKISLFDIENNSYLFDKYSKLIIDKSTLDDTTKMIVDGFDEF